MNGKIIPYKQLRKKLSNPQGYKPDDIEPKLSWEPILIPDGDYQAYCFDYKTKRVRKWKNERRLWLWFEIYEGKYRGKRTYRSYPYPEKVSPCSAYYKEWLIANKGKKPARNSRLSPKVFLNKIFLVSVRKVKSGEYSVIGSIKELVAGGNQYEG